MKAPDGVTTHMMLCPCCAAEQQYPTLRIQLCDGRLVDFECIEGCAKADVQRGLNEALKDTRILLN